MIKHVIYPCCVAFCLLTRVPVPPKWLPDDWDAHTQSASLLYYPLVGLFIGGVLACLMALLPTDHFPMVCAAMVLSAWVAITGALHIDGLADCADAAFAAHKDPELSLKVFKDPHVGSIAVVVINLYLLTKFCVILAFLPSGNDLFPLILSPVMARLAAVFYMMYTPYVSANGLATLIDANAYKKYQYIWLGILVLVVAGLTSVSLAVCLLLTVFLVGYCWRRYWLNNIAGYTGDCVGGLILLIELASLLVILLFVGAG